MEMKEILSSVIVPVLVASLTSYATFEIQNKSHVLELERIQQQFKNALKQQEVKLRSEYERNINMVRTNAKAEEAVKKLLEFNKWELRTFKTISNYLIGYEDNELRKILIAAGALRFPSKVEGDKEEYWGLIERNLGRYSANLKE